MDARCLQAQPASRFLCIYCILEGCATLYLPTVDGSLGVHELESCFEGRGRLT